MHVVRADARSGRETGFRIAARMAAPCQSIS